MAAKETSTSPVEELGNRCLKGGGARRNSGSKEVSMATL